MSCKFPAKTWAWTLVGLLTLALAACSGENTPPDSGYTDGTTDGEQDCSVICSTDADCCAGLSCLDGVCSAGDACPSGCNYECDKTSNQVCNGATKVCETGAPPVNCVDECDCYTGETCSGGQCVPFGGDEVRCTVDGDCEEGEVCRDGSCRPDDCATREDCAGAVCLVCENSQCTAPPPVCQGDQDCCVGFRCNFGTCIPVVVGCESDSDCLDPEFPRCKLDTHECVPECLADIDCPLPGYVCIDTHCISPGCTPEQCQQGEWCDQGDGNCKAGCDSNDDCLPPNTCNYGTHQCGQVDCCGGICTAGTQYCDGLTCQCVDLCLGPDDCPANYTCDVGSGKCMCTDLACPVDTHCDQASGQCVRDGDECDPNDPNSCPAGYTCDPVQMVCISQGGQGEGDPCFSDAECDAAAGLLCDNAIFCIFCIISDEFFAPSMTCRYECSWLSNNCPAGQDCLVRRSMFGMLCYPPSP